MKKILAATFFFTFIFYIQIKAQTQTITELRFPYKPGYTLKLAGTSTVYAQDGSTVVDTSVTEYYIDKDVTLKGKRWVNFHSKSISKDTTLLYDSPLRVDETGMSWFEANQEKGKKNITQAIKLPLSQGATWNTYTDGKPAVCSCLSTHTFVNTSKGDIEAFCVQTLVALKKTKTYTYYLKVVEFYNQDIYNSVYGKFRSNFIYLSFYFEG